MTEHEQRWINEATYEDLLRKIREEPINSSWMTGDTGQHLFKRYHALKESLTIAEVVRASKKVGWRDKKI